jgi:hypothetical protein
MPSLMMTVLRLMVLIEFTAFTSGLLDLIQGSPVNDDDLPIVLPAASSTS